MADETTDGQEPVEDTLTDTDANDIFAAESADDTINVDMETPETDDDPADKPEEDEIPVAEKDEQVKTKAEPKKAEPVAEPAKPAETKQPASKAPATMGDVSMDGLLTTADEVFEKIGDKKVTVPGDDGEPTEVTLSEFREQYPAMFDMMKHLSAAMMEKVLGPVSSYVTEQQGNSEQARMFSEIGEKGHPDAKEVYASKEFNAWADEQGPATQALLDSWDPRDVARGLEIYKQENGITTTAPDKTAEVKTRQAEAKSKTDALHKNTSRTRQTPTTSTDPDAIDPDEARKLFEAEATRDD